MCHKIRGVNAQLEVSPGTQETGVLCLQGVGRSFCRTLFEMDIVMGWGGCFFVSSF